MFVEDLRMSVSELRGIMLPYLIYIFKTTLRAYSCLIPKFGYFFVSPLMISFNHADRCKIWINENFILNCVQKPAPSEEQMLFHTLSMLEAKGGDDELLSNFFH